jgi:hypothetical protein
MLSGLPGGNCPCPHWGNLVKGRMIVRYDDHEEVIEAGDAFYMPPGHAPEAEEGTEIVQFSPAEKLAAVVDALKASLQHGACVASWRAPPDTTGAPAVCSRQSLTMGAQ